MSSTDKNEDTVEQLNEDLTRLAMDSSNSQDFEQQSQQSPPPLDEPHDEELSDEIMAGYESPHSSGSVSDYDEELLQFVSQIPLDAFPAAATGHVRNNQEEAMTTTTTATTNSNSSTLSSPNYFINGTTHRPPSRASTLGEEVDIALTEFEDNIRAELMETHMQMSECEAYIDEQETLHQQHRQCYWTLWVPGHGYVSEDQYAQIMGEQPHPVLSHPHHTQPAWVTSNMISSSTKAPSVVDEPTGNHETLLNSVTSNSQIYYQQHQYNQMTSSFDPKPSFPQVNNHHLQHNEYAPPPPLTTTQQQQSSQRSHYQFPVRVSAESMVITPQVNYTFDPHAPAYIPSEEKDRNQA